MLVEAVLQICVAETAHHGRRHAADDEVTFPEIARRSADEIVGERFHFARELGHTWSSDARCLTARDGIEQADSEASTSAARDLRGAEDGGVFGDIRELAGVGGDVRTLRRPTDASRVERLDRRHIAAEVAAEIAEAEHTRVGDEERALFVEECLECAEVHRRWVDLDLTEVGIQREVEREIRREQCPLRRHRRACPSDCRR
jgi:hypothetical protein